MVAPSFTVETELHATGARWVIGCDEVGRGALAGPVAVGVSAVSADAGPIPDGLRDSKLLSEPRREVLEPLARGWAHASAVGFATADEIDRVGIIAALGLAGARAIAALREASVSVAESIVLLDGKHDWLTASLTAQGLCGADATGLVRSRVKADRDCASVAAASVIAKVARDRLMIDADGTHPGYGWMSNKGYGSSAHLEAIRELGATELHRHTWLGSASQPTLI